MSMVAYLRVSEDGFKTCDCPACGEECNVHDSEFNAKIKDKDKEYDEYSVECTNCHQIFYTSQCY